MKIGIVCYPTYGGSGIVATELGMDLAEKGHEVHFFSTNVPINKFLHIFKFKNKYIWKSIKPHIFIK